MHRVEITALFALMVLAPPSVTGSRADSTTFASRDEIVKGFGAGCGQTYLGTHHAGDDLKQCLIETEALGVPDTPMRLENKWLFQCVPPGDQYLNWSGWRNETANDRFRFLYCTCNRFIPGSCDTCDANHTYISMFGAVIDGENGSGLNFAVTTAAIQEMHILVMDSGPRGDDQADDVTIDLLNIESTGSASNPAWSQRIAATDHQTGPGSIFAGTYQDTWLSDDRRQVLKETLVNGKSRLKHVWQFNDVPAGSQLDLVVEGFRPGNADGDDFRFGMNTGGGSRFLIIPDATISTMAETPCGFAYPFAGPGVGGTIYIMIEDTVAAGTDLATVQIDQILIRTLP